MHIVYFHTQRISNTTQTIWLSKWLRCVKNYNNDFDHECFDEAVSGLGAKALPLTSDDEEIQRFSIPGCGKIRFFPHQVWGVYFVVKNLLAQHGLNNVLVADDMGMGKVHDLCKSLNLTLC